MAKDMDTKLRVRAFFECNDLSYAKVAAHFEALGYETKKSTVERWGQDEGWVKGKYQSLKNAIEDLLPNEIMQSLGEESKKAVVAQHLRLSGEGGGSQALDTEVLDDDYAEAVSREVIWSTLNRHALMGELADNLKKTAKIVSNSNAIGAKATYHQMVISTIQTVHGKKVVMTPADPSSRTHTEEEMQKMSIAELEALAKGEL